MEDVKCVRDLVKAVNQYQGNASDIHLVQVQRQLDILITITKKRNNLSFFNPKDLIVVECLTCLVEILKNRRSKPLLVQKTMQLLDHLANDSSIRHSLNITFHMAAQLTSYLNPENSSEPNQFLCVKLLQKILYGYKVSFQESYVEHLIHFLLQKLPSKTTELTEPCLGLLASLCRNNFAVQNHIKNNMDVGNTKQLLKALLPNLSNGSNCMKIFSLSIILSLNLEEEGKNLFYSGKNIRTAFMMIVNILLNDNDTITRMYVVDLFVDILQHESRKHHLSIYPQLPVCIEKLFSLVVNNKSDTVSKILELLLTFCSVTGVRSVVCKILLDSPGVKDKRQYEQLYQNQQVTEPFFALVQWAAQPMDSNTDTPILALDLLKEMYEELMTMDVNMAPRTELILPVLSAGLIAPSADKEPSLKECRKVIKTLKLLKCFNSDESLRLQLSQDVRVETCQKLIEYHFLHNKLSGRGKDETEKHKDWSDASVQIVLLTLEMMVQLENYLPGMKTVVEAILQNQDCVLFLAHGLLSQCREVVHTTLTLAVKSAAYIDFPLLFLGDSVASLNASVKQRTEREVMPSVSENNIFGRNASIFCDENKENVPIGRESSISNLISNRMDSKLSSEMENNVTSLIEKMQTDMDLKDVKTSEILQVYDHKFQSLQTKENHLQDLLDAKSMALEQADRLIAQYRCRKAQADVEAQKLRTLIQDCEKHNEELRETVNDATIEKERLQGSVERLGQENIRLEAIAEEYKEICQAHAEQSQLLDNVQYTLTNLKKEHQAVQEMHVMLRRHNETLKQQHDVTQAELEELSKTSSKQLKDKENKNIELTKNLKKLEAKLSKLESNCEEICRERDDLERGTDKLQVILDKTEKKKKELQQQLSTLEILCRQHESGIKEKDEKLAFYKTEVDKHAQIAALIHNLSKGGNPQSK